LSKLGSPLIPIGVLFSLCIAFSGAGFAAAQQSSDDQDRSTEAQAEEPRQPSTQRGGVARWSITFAAFVTDFDTKARWDDKTLGDGTLISLEKDLGLDEDLTKARVDGVVRLGKRSHLNVGYLRLRRSAARKVLEREIVWGDQVYELNATVETDFDTDVYKVGWAYTLFKKPRFAFGISAGVSAFDLAGSIRGIAAAGGGQGSAEFQEEEAEELLAPVPVIGIHGVGSLRRDLILRAHGQFFTYDDGEWDVEFVDYLVALEYIPFEHVGFGLGYDWFSIEYRQDKYDLRADYEFEGVTVFVRAIY
jgi:hypothetical protein